MAFPMFWSTNRAKNSKIHRQDHLANHQKLRQQLEKRELCLGHNMNKQTAWQIFTYFSVVDFHEFAEFVSPMNSTIWLPWRCLTALKDACQQVELCEEWCLDGNSWENYVFVFEFEWISHSESIYRSPWSSLIYSMNYVQVAFFTTVKAPPCHYIQVVDAVYVKIPLYIK